MCTENAKLNYVARIIQNNIDSDSDILFNMNV